MATQNLKRQLAHVKRAKAVITDLLDSLGATTSYAQREPRRREKVPWRALYGWQMAFQAKQGCLLDSDGKPSQIELVRKFSHNPGDIITSNSARRTGSTLTSYMVRHDHSLSRMAIY